MAAAIEDEVLSALAAGSLVYDQLRQRTGAHPGELDRAIARLQASHQVVREGARIALVGMTAPAPARVAQASAADAERRKACTKCGQVKPFDEFYERDGKPTSACKLCIRADVKARSQGARAGSPAKRAKKAPVAKAVVAPTADPVPAEPAAPPRATAPKVALLPFLDGVRLGYVTTSPSGIVRMTDCIDLSEAQLDEICREWAEFRRTDVAT
jgi:hypothetical protein